eukprot:CAMPEP_0198733260 /NCGR_PEP_ID=MMETSP1475-20131203/44159_1 /TAXON_ID= ORGANISM="Unidentified sp., Strain CCMP1999" /NCGR_SAMPLE_ID=MMETSP1475 /ASSEMBLY_ACC=CAM_ASM_001111 /LENGTH=404 /DNA_ID=CAMNT_0044496533 /DNA_START=39 /DNA_END=1253 /DNA_ORIENTATION=+
MQAEADAAGMNIKDVMRQLSIKHVGSLIKRGRKTKGHAEENRRHSFKVHGTKFNVDKRYTFIRPLGTGAYGIVCAAKDAVHKCNVAIKYIPDVFDDLTDARRILREVRLTQHLRHENLIHVKDLDTEAAYCDFKDMYMTTELMDTDLRRILNKEKILDEDQTKYIIYQIFKALKYLHSASIYHRDIKPANILVNRSCDIKICDFGLARYVDPLRDDMKTDYVVTRWYRAPELILSRDYTFAIDIWSVGCILAEMLVGKVIFPGKDIKDQVALICKFLGKPKPEEMQHITSKTALEFLASLPETDKVPFKQLLESNPTGANFSPEVLDLLDRTLVFDPSQRISAEQALSHPWFVDFRDAENERTFEGLPEDLISLEPPAEGELGIDDLRQLLWEEVQKFRTVDKY